MENRIKECQLDLFADRTSSHTMRANQLRLWFSSFAYVLIEALRRLGLGHTRFAQATPGTIRAKLFKIGAQVAVASAAFWCGCPAFVPIRPNSRWLASGSAVMLPELIHNSLISWLAAPSNRSARPEPAPIDVIDAHPPFLGAVADIVRETYGLDRPICSFSVAKNA